VTAAAIFLVQIPSMFPVGREIFFTFLRDIFGQWISDAWFTRQEHDSHKNEQQYILDF
jgi:hypothetical protein